MVIGYGGTDSTRRHAGWPFFRIREHQGKLISTVPRRRVNRPAMKARAFAFDLDTMVHSDVMFERLRPFARIVNDVIITDIRLRPAADIRWRFLGDRTPLLVGSSVAIVAGVPPYRSSAAIAV